MPIAHVTQIGNVFLLKEWREELDLRKSLSLWKRQ